MTRSKPRLGALLTEVRACTICADALPHGVRPVLQAAPKSRVLIAGQAPGRKVHESGVPFDDASGERLREWLGVDRDVFYDASQIAILPMGFCYPGTGKSGDLPPRPECAAAWRQDLMARLGAVEWTVVIGRYAFEWHLQTGRRAVTDVVRSWAEFEPSRCTPIPHPSPRNNIWLKRNPWFESELLPVLRRRVRAALEA